MKIVFIFFHETYFKENTKNYATNSNALIFLISVIFVFFSYNLGRREYTFMNISTCFCDKF